MLLGLQNHNHGSIPATGEQLCRLLDDVGSPWVVGIMDTGQWKWSPGVGPKHGEGTEPGEEESPVGQHYLDHIRTAGAARPAVLAGWSSFSHRRVAAPRAWNVRAKFYRLQSGTEAWLDYGEIAKALREVNTPLADAEALSFVAAAFFTPICCAGRIQRLGRNCLRRAQRRDGRDGCRAAGGGPLADAVRPAQALTCDPVQSPDSVSPAVAAAASEAEAADRRNPRQAQPPHTPPASVSVQPPSQPQAGAPQL